MKTGTKMKIRVWKMSRWLALVVVGVAALATAGAQGQDPAPGMGPHRPPMERAMGPHGDHGRWWNDQRSIDKYKLTDPQRKAMDEIYQQHRMTLVDLHATLEKAELAMEPLMHEDQPDEGKILQQIDRVAQARAELEKANARMLLGLRKELTPEQWKQLQADRASRRMGPASHSEGRRWGGQPGGQGTPGGPPPPPPGAPNGPGEFE